jgi:hypothetical protein
MMKLHGFLFACAALLLLTGFCGLVNAEYISTLTGMSGLVSNWHLDETSGNAADAVPGDGLDGDNPGTYSGTGYTQGVAGPRPSDGFLGFSAGNKAVNFSGDTSTLLQMATHSVYGGLTDASMIMWVQYHVMPTGSSSRQCAGGLQKTAGSRYILGAGLYDPPDTGGLQTFTRRSDETGSNSAKYNPGLDTWHMVGVTFEGGKVAQCYLDGEYKETFCDYADSVGLAAPDGLIFGRDINGTRPWKGELDEIAIFNRALSATEMGTLWTAAQVPEPSTVLMLVLTGLGVVIFRRRSR